MNINYSHSHSPLVHEYTLVFYCTWRVLQKWMSFQAKNKRTVAIFLSMTQNEWENFISNGSTPIIMLQHACFGSLKSVLHIRRNYTMNYKKAYFCDTNSFLCEGMLSETAQRILENVCINFVSCSSFSFFFLIFNLSKSFLFSYSTHKISGHFYSCTGCSLS